MHKSAEVKNSLNHDEKPFSLIEENNKSKSTENVEIKKETQELRPNVAQQIKEPEPSYYAVIPANVRYDTRLSPLAKLLYGEITCLCQKEGFCWATNAYFAKLYKKRKDWISRVISLLAKCGYISIELKYKAGTKEIEARYISLRDVSYKKTITEKHDTPITEKHDTPIVEKHNTPIVEKHKGNNTSNINNTSINNIYIRAKDCASMQIEPDIGSKNNKCTNKCANKNNTQPLIENKNTEPLSATKNKSLRKSKPKLAPKVLEEEFDTVWDLYPKKKDKIRAFKAFSKARKEGVPLEKIREGVQKYVQEIENTGVAHQYIKYASTWFNNRCWEDEYDTNTKSSYNLNAYEKSMDTFEGEPEEPPDQLGIWL